MNSVIKGASYVLVHTPDMVLYNGTTQTTERVVNPESEYLKELRFGNYDFQVLRKSDFFSRFFKCHHIKKDSLILKYPFIFVGMFPSTYGIYIIEHEPIFKWLKEGDIYGGW